VRSFLWNQFIWKTKKNFATYFSPYFFSFCCFPQKLTISFHLGENCVIKILPNISTKHFMTDTQYRGGNEAGKLKVSEIIPSYWGKWHKTVSIHAIIFSYPRDELLHPTIGKHLWGILVLQLCPGNDTGLVGQGQNCTQDCSKYLHIQRIKSQCLGTFSVAS